MRPNPALSLLLGPGLCCALLAQTPLKNINTQPRAGDASGTQVVASGAQTFFAVGAEATPHLQGLWATGGTAATTRLVKAGVSPIRIGPIPGGVMFSLGSDEAQAGSWDLWRSDGTELGTILLLGGATLTSFDAQRGRIGNDVFFCADDGVSGSELWRTDGTPAGTRRVVDLWPGWNPGLGSAPIALGAHVYFTASNGTTGYELWRSDGTAAGTTLVADIIAGGGGSLPQELIAYQGALYFTAADSAGQELWRSDGTTAGTLRLVDIAAGAASSIPRGLAIAAGKLWFSANNGVNGDEPWISDGTSAGTHLVADLNSASSLPDRFTTAGARVVFRAFGTATTRVLWSSDGTNAGTFALPGTPAPISLCAFGAQVLFAAAATSPVDYEPYVTDGTIAGTQKLAELWPAQLGAFPDWSHTLFGPSGSGAYFVANMPPKGNAALMRTDGTPAGTQRVTTLVPADADAELGEIVAVGERIFFAANDGIAGQELWTSDGTSGGTRLVRDIVPGPDGAKPFGLSAVRGAVLFFTSSFQNPPNALWRSDGTAAGTTSVLTGLTVQDYAVFRDRLYFADRLHGLVYESDGTVAGTKGLTFSIALSPPLLARAKLLHATSERLVYAGNWSGNAIIAFDGSTYTRLLGPTSAIVDPLFASSGGRLFFALGGGGTFAPELWTSDGTTAGTYRVQDLSSAGVRELVSITPVGTQAFVFVYANDGTSQLWRSNGTPNAMQLVKAQLSTP